MNPSILSSIVLACAFSLIVGGCATKVTRVAPETTIDLTGRWNDTDSRLVAEEMIKDCLAQPWLYAWEERKTRPTVIVGKITNMSHEHINTVTFAKNFERALLNSGRLDFVATQGEREQLRDEKADQSLNASARTAKSAHEETASDYLLLGSINTIVDQSGSKAVLYYQTNLELVDIETNQKVWIGEKKIKKYVERASVSY